MVTTVMVALYCSKSHSVRSERDFRVREILQQNGGHGQDIWKLEHI
jgi:hypothetical protein